LAQHALSAHFGYFFNRLNPSPSFEAQASSEYNTIKGLIENRGGLAAALRPKCFLQGSYRQQTAIYTINDVDVVALCDLTIGGPPAPPQFGAPIWTRDSIFHTIAAPLLSDGRYRNKVRYNRTSMCVKVDLGIKVEILPVVYKAEHYPDDSKEPFALYRPERAQWEDGYARYHQWWLSNKNARAQVSGTFIPMIKVVKHLRTLHGVDAVSFHLECLLFQVIDQVYGGSPADYICRILNHLATIAAEDWYKMNIYTPCGDRDIFTAAEWSWLSWAEFHGHVRQWAAIACAASNATDKQLAVRLWQNLLGADYFPAYA
jgi:hypothetical protein